MVEVSIIPPKTPTMSEPLASVRKMGLVTATMSAFKVRELTGSEA